MEAAQKKSTEKCYHTSIYNPPINFRAILLAFLRPRRYLPRDFLVARRYDKVNKVSLFSAFIVLIISNGSSKNKLVLSSYTKILN